MSGSEKATVLVDRVATFFSTVCESKVMQCIKIEKEVERKLVVFMGKVDYKIKTLEGSVYKKMAEMEEKINERFKDHIDERLRNHVTRTAVEEAIQKVNDNAMSYADKARVDIKEDLKVNFAHDMKENIKTKITGTLQEAQSLLQETRFQVKEQLDKEARRNNVIIYRAPKSTKTTAKERFGEDREYILELFNEVLEVDCNTEDIKKCFGWAYVANMFDLSSLNLNLDRRKTELWNLRGDFGVQQKSLRVFW